MCSQEDILDQLTCTRQVVRIYMLSFAPRRFAPALQQPEKVFAGYNSGLKEVLISRLATKPQKSLSTIFGGVFHPYFRREVFYRMLRTLRVCRTCSLSMSDTMPCSSVSSVCCCGSWSLKLFLKLLSPSLSSWTSSAYRHIRNNHRTTSQSNSVGFYC